MRAIALTAAQVGWESTQPTWGSGEGRVVEVYDRRTGARIARYSGANTFVSSAGDRIIIAEGDDEDDPRVHVVAAG